MKKFTWLFKLVGIIVFSYILVNLNWPVFWRTFSSIHITYLAYYLFFYLTYCAMRIYRFHLLLKAQGYQIKPWLLYCITIEASFWNAITPGKLGEFTKAYYLSNHSVEIGKSISLVIIERIFDFLLLLMLAIAGIGYYLSIILNNTFLILYLSFVIILFFIIYHLKSLLLKITERHCSKYKTYQAIKKSFNVFLPLFKNSYKMMLVTSVVLLSINLLFVFFLAKSFGIFIGFMPVSLTYAIALIASLIPISIGGLGVREFICIVTFAAFGVTQEQSVLFSLFGVIWSYLMVLVLMIPIWIV